MASIFPIPQPQAPPRVGPAGLPDEVLQLQGQVNTALEWLLTTRATMDSCHRELELNAKLAMCMNEAQAVKAIKVAEVGNAQSLKEAKVHCTAEVKEVEVHCEAVIKEAKVCHATTIKEAESCHATVIKEAKLCHTTRTKEAKVQHTTNACVLQQTYRESVVALEHEAMAEEGWDC